MQSVRLARGSVLEPLANGDFVRLWLANGLWWQAMWMEMLALGWLALELTNSPWWVQVIAFYRAVPLLIVGLFGAVITDRFRRRYIVCVLQLVNVLGLGLLALLLFHGELEVWHLSVVSLVLGAAWALDWPTRRSMVPDLVGKARIVDAMVLENVIQGITRIAGPLAAGYVTAAYGSLGALLVLVGLGTLGLILLAGMKTDSRAPARGTLASGWAGRQGWASLRASAPIFGVFLVTVLMNIWTFPYMNLLPVFARDVYGLGPEAMGWLGAAGGAGTIVGLAAVQLGRRNLSNEWVFVGGSLLSCMGIAAFAFSGTLGLALVMLFCSGLGQAGFSIMQSSIILMESPDEMRSRAMSTLVVAIGVGPFGRLQSGALAETWGARGAVGIMAVLGALGIAATAVFLRGFVGRRERAAP